MSGVRPYPNRTKSLSLPTPTGRTRSQMIHRRTVVLVSSVQTFVVSDLRLRFTDFLFLPKTSTKPNIEKRLVERVVLHSTRGHGVEYSYFLTSAIQVSTKTILKGSCPRYHGPVLTSKTSRPCTVDTKMYFLRTTVDLNRL